MASQAHISNVCMVNNNAVYINGQPVFVSAETDMQAFLVEAYKQFKLNYTRFYKMDSLSKLGWLTSEILLQGFDKSQYAHHEIGLVLTTANASLDSDLKYMASVADIPSPALFVYTLPNIMMGEISIRNQFKGESACFVTESFDVDLVVKYVTGLLDNYMLKACICGWVDVLGNDYKAALFLVEKGEGDIAFNAANMNKYFNDTVLK